MINAHNKTSVSPVWPLGIFSAERYLVRETDSLPDERRAQAIVLNALLLEIQRIEEVLGTLPNWQEGDTYIDHLLGSMIYGSGLDGDVTIAAGTTTLSGDMYYENLTVVGTLETAGFRVFVRHNLIVESTGIITNSGGNASGTTGGTAPIAGTIGGGADGGDNTQDGDDITDGIGQVGGPGGSGGAGGSVTAPNPLPGIFDVAVATTLQWLGVQLQGGAGGGGGSTANGGGGGAGGGVMMIAARKVFNAGSIQARGGNGANGTVAGGGGGGGGGGAVVVVTSQPITGNQPSALGGTPGLGAGGANDGTGGANGPEYVVIL